MLGDKIIVERLLKMQHHEEEIIWIGDRQFLVSPATEDDIERLTKGFESMD